MVAWACAISSLKRTLHSLKNYTDLGNFKRSKPKLGFGDKETGKLTFLNYWSDDDLLVLFWHFS